MTLLVALLLAASTGPDALRAVARDYFAWRDRNDPVGSSEQGLHTWDDQLSDPSMPRILERRRHVQQLLAQVKALRTDGWSKDDRVDAAVFRAELERVALENSRAPLRGDESARLRRRVQLRDLLAPEEGICAAQGARSRRHRAAAEDARLSRGGEEEPEVPDRAVRPPRLGVGGGGDDSIPRA